MNVIKISLKKLIIYNLKFLCLIFYLKIKGEKAVIKGSMKKILEKKVK
jgi:hypothetical protein